MFTFAGVIEVTASGKWPEDLDAIARLKAAFYIDLSDRLDKEHKIVSQVHPDYLDVYQVSKELFSCPTL